MLGPNDPLNPDIPDPDAPDPGAHDLPPDSSDETEGDDESAERGTPAVILEAPEDARG